MTMIRLLLATTGLCALCAPALASFHLVQINEVYSNADGTVQYVELIALANNQTNLSATRIVARDETNGNETILFDFVESYAWSNGQTLLVATPGFEAVAGFAPDFVMPANSLIFSPDGRVLFRRNTAAAVDSIAYGAYSAGNGNFGDPFPQPLPTDGVHSLTRVNTSMDNSVGWAIAVNSPTRTDGTTTTLGGGGTPCPGDFNGDLVVDFADLSVVLGEFGTTYQFSDLSEVLANFGTNCATK
jgi:hypothetical protein